MGFLQQTKTKESIAEALLKNTAEELLVPEKPAEVAPVPSRMPSADKLVEDSEDDFDFARKKIRHLIDTAGEAMEPLLALAQDSEHPRAFEVLTTMIKETANMSSQLLELNKERKKILTNDGKKGVELPAGNNITGNIIFAGTTTELNKMLKKDQPIDV